MKQLHNDTVNHDTISLDTVNHDTVNHDTIKNNILSFDQLYKLININLAVNDNYDNFEVVLQRLLHAIEIITKSEATSLLVYDENQKDLIFKYATGNTAHHILGLRVPHGEGIAHMVANTRKGIVINKIEDFNHYQNIDIEIEYKTKTMMAYPVLNNKGGVFGVVEVCNKEHNGQYTHDDFHLLSIFCQQAEKTIRHALHIHTLKNNITALTNKIENMSITPLIYDSKEMKKNIDIMYKIAKSDAPVLIQGDKGTGKSLFSKHIHYNSYRKHQEIIEISCTELVKTSENTEDMRIVLWGIDKDYKLSIKKDTVGLFEQANGGTVVLNEIEALPLEIQKEITTLLVQKIYYKVLSDTPNILDVRIICTSAIHFSKQIESGTFLEELYFLISSLPIRLSPLKNRIEDLSVLIDYYFSYFISIYHKDITQVEPEAMIILKRYNWHHNIHSLRSAIDYLVLHCDTNVLSALYVATYMLSIQESNTKDTAFDDLLDMNIKEVKNTNQDIMTLQDAINTFKAQYLHKTLLLNNWNHTKTAKKLAIQRSYLSRLVKTYNLNNKTES